MTAGIARMTALVGLWTMAAPFLVRWGAGSAAYASNVVPGLATLLVAGYVALTSNRELSEEQEQLSASLTASVVLLGCWVLISPFILGFRLSTVCYAATLVPGAATIALGVAAGYAAWRRLDW